MERSLGAAISIAEVCININFYLIKPLLFIKLLNLTTLNTSRLSFINKSIYHYRSDWYLSNSCHFKQSLFKQTKK